jgi:ribosomal protein S18 acetylase RimI-like enzyme
MVSLRPMTEKEVASHLERTAVDYAAAHVRGGTYPAEGAVDRAHAELAGILPQGPATPGHFFRWVEAVGAPRPVGMVWYAARPSGTGETLFIYDIEIEPEFRRKGHAEATLREVERIARARGARSVSLHVFGDNIGAIALYEKLGYLTTNRMMAKPLDPSTA